MNGAAGRSRTSDLLVRSQLLYPAELRPHIASRQLSKNNGDCGIGQPPGVYKWCRFADLKEVVRPEGFEPPTLWFEAKCSIQLSYGRGKRLKSYSQTLAKKRGYSKVQAQDLSGRRRSRSLRRLWREHWQGIDDIEASTAQHLVNHRLGQAGGVVFDADGLLGFVEFELANAIDLTKPGYGKGCRLGRRSSVTIENVKLGHSLDDSSEPIPARGGAGVCRIETW
jgi:hypothetical protein